MFTRAIRPAVRALVGESAGCLAILALCALTVWIYSPLRTAGFVYEDAKWLSVLGINTDWSLNLNARLANASHPYGYHLGNLFLHLVNGLLLGLCARAIWSLRVGIFTAAIFLIHPLNSEAVSYIAARGELLSAAWLLCAVFVAVSGTRYPAVRAVLAMAFTLAAVWAKASAIVVLGLLPFALLYTKRDDVLKWYGLCWIVVVGALGSYALAVWRNPYTWQSEWGAWRYLVLQSGALFVLLSKVLVPIHLTIDPDWAAIPLMAQVSAFLLLLVALVTAVCRRYRTWPVVIWIALCVWPRFLLRSPELLHVHHLLLAMLGISTALGVWCAHLWEGSCVESCSV